MISLIDENMCLICSTRALACAPQLIYHIEHLSKCSGCKVLPNVPATTGCRKIMQLHPQVYNLSRVPSEHISMWTFHVSRTFTLIGKSKAAEWNRDIINFSTTKSKKKRCNDPQHISLIVLVGFIWATAYSSCWAKLSSSASSQVMALHCNELLSTLCNRYWTVMCFYQTMPVVPIKVKRTLSGSQLLDWLLAETFATG